MDGLQIFSDKQQLATAAVKKTIALLRQAIDQYGQATWVLAGGSTPLLAYEIIANNYEDAIDWSQVTIIIGDERIGPLDGPDNNWHAIDTIIGALSTTKLRPQSDKSAKQAAADYEQQLLSLPKADNGTPRFDVVWLGVGQDGHTLSLFPNHSSLLPSSSLVIPVHDSPKPPSDRISLSLRAIQGIQHALILAAGVDKKDAIAAAQKNSSLPIALIASILTTHEKPIEWLVDREVALES